MIMNGKMWFARFALSATLIFLVVAGLAAQDSIGSLETPSGVRVSRASSNPNYPVTPGDVYQLTYSAVVRGNGGSSQSLLIFVEPDYTVNLEFLGTIEAEELTFQQLRQRILSLVQQAYPGSTARVTVQTTGEIPIHLRGEVVSARTIPVWGLTRLGDLPDNLFTDYASARSVQITSRDGETNTYDLFRARRFGDSNENPLLEVGDTITAPQYDRRISISGAVRRPGTYELLPEEGAATLLEFAGGMTRTAREDDIRLTRLGEGNQQAVTDHYVTRTELLATALKDQDSVDVPSQLERRPVMYIEGALAESGSPSGSTRVSRVVRENQRLYDVAQQNQGLFTPVSDLENAYLRRNGNEIIPIDLVDLLHGTGQLTANPVVQPEDVLVIPFKQFQVTVLGGVARPGSYPWVPNRTWSYYVQEAGGLNPDLSGPGAIEVRNAEEVKVDKDEVVGPEYTIVAKRNNVRFWYLRSADLATTTIDLFNAVFSLLQTLNVVSD